MSGDIHVGGFRWGLSGPEDDAAGRRLVMWRENIPAMHGLLKPIRMIALGGRLEGDSWLW